MSDQDAETKARSKLLSRALRAVRGIRNAKPRDLAKALGLSLRGYQNFEAGGGQVNIEHVMRFARAIDCDPIGVLAAVQIGKPEFAAWVAQNKAMIAFMISLQEFAEETGESMARLETTTWVSAYREMFKGLTEKARAAELQNAAWMSLDAARVGLAAPAPAAPPEPEPEPSTEAPPASSSAVADAPKAGS